MLIAVVREQRARRRGAPLLPDPLLGGVDRRLRRRRRARARARRAGDARQPRPAWAGSGRCSASRCGSFMLGFAGLPLTGGFVGKFYVFSAAYDRGWTWLVIVGVVATRDQPLLLPRGHPRAVHALPARAAARAGRRLAAARARCCRRRSSRASAVAVGSFFAVQPLIDLARGRRLAASVLAESCDEARASPRALRPRRALERVSPGRRSGATAASSASGQRARDPGETASAATPTLPSAGRATLATTSTSADAPSAVVRAAPPRLAGERRARRRRQRGRRRRRDRGRAAGRKPSPGRRRVARAAARTTSTTGQRMPRHGAEFAAGPDGPPGGSLAVVSLPARDPARRARAAALRPDADVHWEHHPSHFWLVLVTALVNVGLGAARRARRPARRGDARLLLVTLAFLSSAGFLGLHALATPGVLLEGTNAGFVVATPVGLLLAVGLRGALGLDLGERADTLVRRQRLLRWALVGADRWSGRGLARRAAAARPARSARTRPTGSCSALAVPALALYVFAAWRYLRLYRRRAARRAARARGRFVLLAEAMVAVAFAPQLARVVVGVARADAGRVRARRLDRAARVPRQGSRPSAFSGALSRRRRSSAWTTPRRALGGPRRSRAERARRSRSSTSSSRARAHARGGCLARARRAGDQAARRASSSPTSRRSSPTACARSPKLADARRRRSARSASSSPTSRASRRSPSGARPAR